MSHLRVIRPGEEPPAEGQPKPDAFDAAVAAARKDGATAGVLIYLTADGDFGYVSAGAGPVVMRGLLEEAHDFYLNGE